MHHGIRQPGQPVLLIEAHESRLRVSHMLAAFHPFQAISKDDSSGRRFHHPAADADLVIVTNGSAVSDLQVGDHQAGAARLQLAIAEPGLAQMLRTGDVQPDDVPGVVHHAHLIGFRVVHPDGGDGFCRATLHMHGIGAGEEVVECGGSGRETGQGATIGAPGQADPPYPAPAGPRIFAPVICHRLVLVGDAHLGGSNPQAELAFLAFLDSVPSLGDGLAVTGDLFEFWFSYQRAVPRRNIRVVGALAELRRKVPIVLVGGNHDRWAADFWQRDVGIEFGSQETYLEVNGGKALLLHGDNISALDRPARVLQRITRNSATTALFRAVHPDLGMWLVDRLSGALGSREKDPERIAAGVARQHAWARRRFSAEPDLSLIAMGHTHVPVTDAITPHQCYVNPGAWNVGYRFAVVGDGKAELRQFG